MSKKTEATQPILPSSTASADHASATGKPKEDALSVLRTETALSRFPLHRLTKGRAVQIELQNQASAVLWRVDHNSRYGQPGALAYKIDSLFINRRIEDSGRPVPKVIRLGSLREIALEVGSGTNTTPVKQALLQNATASITAKISYRAQDGGEQWLEAVFSRYSVVFTGEKLPQGDTADAVYLVLNDIYQQILNNAVFRPLDYEYMKSLPPIAQRFYEIVSYQIYAALHHNNPRAKLAYSEYCLLSTATRYTDFEHVKKQMYKVLKPHIKSGYLGKVEYEATTDERGEPDWLMYLTPGINANREYRAFTGQGKTRKPSKSNSRTDMLSLPFPEVVENDPQAQQDEIQKGDMHDSDASREEVEDTATRELITTLVEADLNRADAERFAREKAEVCRRQLEFLPYVKDFKTSRGAYLRRAIEEDYGPPVEYGKARKRQEAVEAGKRQRARELFEVATEKARQSHQERFYGAYVDYLRKRVGELKKTQPEAFAAFTEGEGVQRAMLTEGPFANRTLNKKALEVFDKEQTHLERCRDYFHEYYRDCDVEILSFWQWDEQLNPEAFRP